jgi:hypothetical protein
VATGEGSSILASGAFILARMKPRPARRRKRLTLFSAYMIGIEPVWLHSLAFLAGPPEWERGRAVFRDRYVCLETRESYLPFEEDVGALLFELAAVEQPEDAVAVASRFGLLRSRPGAPLARERFTVWQEVAGNLSGILKLYVLLRESATDEAAAMQLRQMMREFRQHADDGQRSFLDGYDTGPQASIVIAEAVNAGLGGATERLVSAASVEQHQHGNVVRGEPDHFFFAPELINLEGLAYHQLALTLADGSDIFICARCERARPRTHGNQKHCNTRCRNQKNIRAYRARQTATRS